MAQLRHDYDKFVAQEAEILVVGPENQKAFQEYWVKNSLPFTGLPDPFTATRYHSLVVDRDSLPDCLEITAELEDGSPPKVVVVVAERTTDAVTVSVRDPGKSISDDVLANLFRPFFSTYMESGPLTMISVTAGSSIRACRGPSMTNASAANPGGYNPGLWIFSCLGFFGLLFSFLLRQRETGPHGHGLESITTKSSTA